MSNEMLVVIVVLSALAGLLWAMHYALIDDPMPVKKQHKPS